ncbi:MAG: hypothetical protein Q4G71_12735 [Pseudomonadota bacterium]|nr:hypothetical protein [Pseudomonadota bacterium]
MSRPRAWLLAACVALLAACASPENIAPGTPSAEVLHTLGAPTGRYPLEAGTGGERWQYSWQPAGKRVYNVDVDAQGRVTRVEQALDEGLFEQRIRPGVWTRGDVLREYGPPAQTMGVHNFDGVIWLWRYELGPFPRLLYIDIERDGTVRGYSLGDEYPPEPADH